MWAKPMFRKCCMSLLRKFSVFFFSFFFYTDVLIIYHKTVAVAILLLNILSKALLGAKECDSQDTLWCMYHVPSWQ